MKLKGDFVTNSSSTSFVVVDKTTGEILREMIKIVLKDSKIHPTSREKIDCLLEDPKFDKNVVFPLTMNEETFIYRLCPAKVRVDTCNNHHWEQLPFKRKYVDEWDKVYEKSKKMVFLDMSDFKPKTRNQVNQDRHEEFERSHQKFLKEKEERNKRWGLMREINVEVLAGGKKNEN